MAQNDDRYIPRVPNNLNEVADLLRDIWEVLHALEGRIGPISLRDDLSVMGGVTATGDLSTNVTTDGSVELDNYLQINERVFDSTGALTPAVAPVGSSRIYQDPTSDTLKVSQNGAAYTDLLVAAPTLPSQTCRVYRNAGTAIAHGGTVTMAFNTERWDTDGMHDNAVNNSRITINTAGKYEIGASIEVSNSGTTMWVFVGILRNGATYVVAQAPTVVGNTGYVSLSCVIDGVVGDYYEVIVFQSNTGSAGETIVAAAQLSPEFWAIRIQ